MKAFLVDDEPLAIRRLRQLLEETGRVEIVGDSDNPTEAVAGIRSTDPDVLFLDIEMPGMSGFELLEQLGEPQPLVVYLLKPVGPAPLERALKKVERVLGGAEARGDMQALLRQVKTMLAQKDPEYLVRVPSRIGERVEFIDVSQVTHFYAKDKLTFAVASGKEYALDLSISDLESRLPPGRWLRIHRSTLLNVDAVRELRTWFGGKLLVKLKDGRTELHVARERAAEIRSKLGV